MVDKNELGIGVSSTETQKGLEVGAENGEHFESDPVVLANEIGDEIVGAGEETIDSATGARNDLGLDNNAEANSVFDRLQSSILEAEQLAKKEIAGVVGGSEAVVEVAENPRDIAREFKEAVASGDYDKMAEALFSAEGGIKPEDFYQTLTNQVGKVDSQGKETFLDTSAHTEVLIIGTERDARRDEVMGSGKDQEHNLRLHSEEYDERETKASETLDNLKKEDLVGAVSRCLESGGKDLSGLAVAEILGDEKMMQAIEKKVPGFKEQVMAIISKPEFQTLLQTNVDELRGKVEYLRDKFDDTFSEYQELESKYNEGISVVDPRYNIYNGGVERTGRRGGETMVDEDKKKTGVEMINIIHKYIGAHLDVKNHSDQVNKLEKFLVKKPASETVDVASV